MGGCASRPKDLDINEPAPVQAPAVEKVESEPTSQENNGGEETKIEEPLVDLSEPVGETVKLNNTEEAAGVAEAKVEEKVEEKAEEKIEAKAEEKVEVVAETKVEVQPTTEVASVEDVVTAEPEKKVELINEDVKPVKAPKSEDKSDAPIINA
ncbi:uncharacterized protein LOC141626328 [Silene latifolia]|uniref:uncharacterized protein LOC141626328 n=1 Tax=Silene latifolia TaxID=37657 RepID=UPI003D788989